MVNFYFDRLIDGKPYPNLAKHQALPYTPEWREFSKKWPFSEPVHFLEYLDQENIKYQLVTTPENSIYPISVSFFDFGVNWFDLIDSAVLSALRAKTCVLWFFYSEGDNPFKIDQHLNKLCEQHHIPRQQVHFTSANSTADDLEYFSYFPDDELLFRLRNHHWPPGEFFDYTRKKKFTALVRTHKWWRATTMARLWRQGLHKEGYFSYNNHIDIGDHELDNPIEIDSFAGLRNDIKDFLAAAPFRADSLDSKLHNEYSSSVPDHYSESYLNIILETHLDTDQSKGVFLTEKTFKPIKFCQPFVLLGPPGSIAKLRELGYRTFDHVIDHSYDQIKNNTQRWDVVMREAERLIQNSDLHEIFLSCGDDLVHNREHFLSGKEESLNTLIKKVIE